MGSVIFDIPVMTVVRHDERQGEPITELRQLRKELELLGESVIL